MNAERPEGLLARLVSVTGGATGLVGRKTLLPGFDETLACGMMPRQFALEVPVYAAT